MYNVSENAVPMQYPLAMNGIGTDAGGYSTVGLPVKPMPSSVMDANNLGPVYGGAYTPSLTIPSIIPGKPGTTFVGQSADVYRPPSGESRLRWQYGLKEEFFKGVPNYYVYGGALLLLLAGYFKAKR